MYLDLNTNTKIFYQTYGEEGPWITLINGHTRSHSDFRFFSKKLSNKNYRCLIFDHRGSGATRFQGDFSIEDLLGDIEALWNHLNISQCHLLGISMGGWLSQLLLERHPEKILSTTLISTSDVNNRPIREMAEWGPELEDIKKQLHPYLSNAFHRTNGALINAMAIQIQKNNSEGSFSKGAHLQKQAWLKYDKPCHDNYQGPSLIVHGAEDQILTLNEAKILHQKLPQAHFESIPLVGHLLLAECPSKLLQLYMTFLDSIDIDN